MAALICHERGKRRTLVAVAVRSGGAKTEIRSYGHPDPRIATNIGLMAAVSVGGDDRSASASRPVLLSREALSELVGGFRVCRWRRVRMLPGRVDVARRPVLDEETVPDADLVVPYTRGSADASRRRRASGVWGNHGRASGTGVGSPMPPGSAWVAHAF